MALQSKRKSQKPHFLLNEKVTFWLLVLCTVALVTAIFGKIDVRTLLSGTDVKVIERAAETPTPITAEQTLGRLTVEAYTDKDCDMDWNSDAPSVWVSVEDNDLGVRFELPYNEAWGNAKYILPMYQQRYNTRPDLMAAYRFGPMSPGGACGLEHTAGIRFDMPKSATEVLENLKSLGSETIVSPIKTLTINGMTVYNYETGELGGGPTYSIVGKKYLYTIYSTGWLSEKNATRIIGSLQQFTP